MKDGVEILPAFCGALRDIVPFEVNLSNNNVKRVFISFFHIYIENYSYRFFTFTHYRNRRIKYCERVDGTIKAQI